MWRRRQDERQANKFSCSSYSNAVENRNRNSTVRNYPTQTWFREMNESFGCILLQKGISCMMENPCRLSRRVEQRLWFLLPLMLHLLLKWLILRWKIGIKKIHSPLSKHKLNNCNLLYLLWQWRDGNILLRCWLWMHSPPLLSPPLQAVHYLKLSLDTLSTGLNAHKYCYFSL